MIGSNNARIIVQPRDLELLQNVAKFRWVDREQAKRIAGFRSTTRANTRLLALHKAKLLDRFFIGSHVQGRKAIYALSAQGALLAGIEHPFRKHKHRDTIATSLFVDHQLHTNEAILEAMSPGSPVGVRVRHWRMFQEPLTKGGAIPDAYIEAETPNGIRSLLLEVDLGTETLGIWRKKIENYLAFAKSGAFDREFRQPQFRVLVLAESERRIAHIRVAVSKITDKVFWFSRFAHIRSEGFWAAVWLRPTGDHLHSLL